MHRLPTGGLTGPAPRRAAATALAALLLATLALAGCSQGSSGAPGTTTTSFVKKQPQVVEAKAPTVTVPRNDCDPAVAEFPYHVAYARERGPLPVYEAPGAATPLRTFDNPRLTASDPPAEEKLAFLVKSEPVDEGCAWVEVYLPTRPNGSTGWVKRSDIKMEGHVYRIQVYLSEFTLQVWEAEDLIMAAPIGTATGNNPTPGGTYYITEVIESDNPNTLYGPFALGLSGFSDTITSYNGGPGQLGIHGTNEPDRIGTPVSHGCIRLYNEDIEKLVDSLDTWLGIPVEVYA